MLFYFQRTHPKLDFKVSYFGTIHLFPEDGSKHFLKLPLALPVEPLQSYNVKMGEELNYIPLIFTQNIWLASLSPDMMPKDCCSSLNFKYTLKGQRTRVTADISRICLKVSRRIPQTCDKERGRQAPKGAPSTCEVYSVACRGGRKGGPIRLIVTSGS